jgi:hypothetical protein
MLVGVLFGIRKGQVAYENITVFEFQNGQVACENRPILRKHRHLLKFFLEFKKDRLPLKIGYLLNFKIERSPVKIDQFQRSMDTC